MSMIKYFAVSTMFRCRRLALVGGLALGTMMSAGCEPAQPQEELDNAVGASYGGLPNSYGGLPNSYGGLPNSYGGLPNSYGGLPNGGSNPTGLGWNGLFGFDQQYKGIGWNQSTKSWAGPAWGGTTMSVDCAATGQPVGTLSTGTDNACTTLHNAFNHTDSDGNGTAGEGIDKATRLSVLAHWVACACPNTVQLPFNDTHGWLPNGTTLNGVIGLAPTWCGSDIDAVVPDDEMEIVSACMLALSNTKWRHYNLSLRSTDASNVNSINEEFLLNIPLATYFGNLWKDPHVEKDTTTLPYNAGSPNSSCSTTQIPTPTSCNNLNTAGGQWWNMERFSCQIYTTDSHWIDDQWAYGRECEVSDCGGRLEWLGTCDSNKKRLGDPGTWAGTATSYFKAVDASGAPNAAGGLLPDTSFANGQSAVRSSMRYRGKTYRAMEAWGPNSIPIEDPWTTPPLYDAWSQVESGTVDSSQSVFCSPSSPDALLGNKFECDGWGQNHKRLSGLKSSQIVTINYTGQGPRGNGPYRQGSPTEAVTVAIRYSMGGLLGPGQCDVDLGCMDTPAAECWSGVKSATTGACVGGVSFPGSMRIWIMGNKAYDPYWRPVHGSVSPYGKNIFPTTFAGNKYSTAYIYPIYVQDAAATIPGFGGDHTAGVTYDTLRVRLSGESADTIQGSPNLDTAYFFPGPPPGDADCTGSAGCWMYAGPNQAVTATPGNTVVVNLGQPGFFTSPTLPAGTYTFKMKNVLGDLDLYVQKNGPVSESSYECRPYLGRNQEEVCTITLDKPGYFTAMVKGYANQTCSGSNPQGCDCANFVSGCAAKATVVGSN